MANKVVHHTWAARQISIFSEPMIFPKTININQKDKIDRYEDLNMNEMEKTMTLWLQNNYCYSHQYSKRKRKRRNHTNTTRTNNVQDSPLNRNDDIIRIENIDKDANEIETNHTGDAYVSLSWIPIFPLSSTPSADKSDTNFPLHTSHLTKDKNHKSKKIARKEYSKSRQDKFSTTSPYHYPEYHHLHIEIWAHDELKSQILLCFPNHHHQPIPDDDEDCNRNDNHHQNSKRHYTLYNDSEQYLTISSFSFLLVRGSNDVCHKIFQFLESMYGCMIVVPKKEIMNPTFNNCNLQKHRGAPSNNGVENTELNPVRFSPFEIASTLLIWTVTNYQYYRHTCNLDTFSSEKTTSSSSKSSSSLSSSVTSKSNVNKIRPMEVTFALPCDISKKGLESITMTIPPLALINLCNALENQSLQFKKEQNNDWEQDQDDISIQSQLTGKGDNDSKSMFTFAENNDIPILQALQCYMMETFHIDIRSFQLIRATCGIASLGCDGRCKPMNVLFLHDFLVSIHSIMSNRTNFL